LGRIKVVKTNGSFPFVVFLSHCYFCLIYLALLRVTSWIVHWAGKGKTIHEITRTDTKHNGQNEFLFQQSARYNVAQSRNQQALNVGGKLCSSAP
jgi:hypothetical protein